MSTPAPAPTTVDRILEAAVRLFARQGYVATSMEEIAREVGITKPAIYHHFKGKDALLRALAHIVERENGRLIDEVRNLRLPLPDLMLALIERRLALARAYPDWIRFMLRLDIASTDIPEVTDLFRMHEEWHARELALVESALGGLALRPGVGLDRFVQFSHDAVFAYIARTTVCGQCGIDDPAVEARYLRDMILFGALGRTDERA